MVWNAHKSVLRDLFLKIGAHEIRTRYSKTTAQYLDHIRALKFSNKISHTTQSTNSALALAPTSVKIWISTLNTFDSLDIPKEKNNSRVLADQYKHSIYHSKIPYLTGLQRTTYTNPLDIANCFRIVMSITRLSPSDSIVQFFLSSVQLHSVTSTQLSTLSQPFTEQ